VKGLTALWKSSVSKCDEMNLIIRSSWKQCTIMYKRIKSIAFIAKVNK
jgi:hypothetical protein